ncbi:unnamed protein product [Pieris macdunnoughi]|uniref:Ankyrin repeat domain-containing protein 39 n=1 Tax=Pieris macdunnoughi TaxID=345717 RepID=A0A821M2U5_9NEOP|nr:unnamed protein product [Pieris macdunnoughi]
MEGSHCNHDCHITNANKSVCQTLSEMDWERGIWNAAFSGDKDRITELINKSRNITETVNVPDNAGYTALHYAARNGHLDICKLLLGYGAILDVQTKSGKATPLHKAVATGKLSTVKFLIESGAKTDLIDDDGKTILHKAVEYKREDLVNMLLETHPNLQNVKDKKGLLPLDYKTSQ